MSRNIIFAIYYIVLVLAIGLSSVFSFYGFLPTLGSWALALPFVAIIGLGLFAAGALVQIARDRKSVKEQLLAVLLFIVFAMFSTSSNFTYFYTEMRAVIEREEAVREEREKFETAVRAMRSRTSIAVEADRAGLQDLASWYGSSVSDELSSTLGILPTVPEYSVFLETLERLDFELGNIREQANDPIRPGCGDRCRAHIEIVNNIVVEETGTALTDIVVPRDILQFNEFLQRYERRVWTEVCEANQQFVALFVFSNGNSPAPYCVISPSQITADELFNFTRSPEGTSVETVANFITELGARIAAVNVVLSAAQSDAVDLVQLDTIPATIDSAAAAYTDLEGALPSIAALQPEIINQRQQFLTELESALLNASIDQNLLYEDENCSVETVREDPRACLQRLSGQLVQLQGGFRDLFSDNEMPEVARDAIINVENGQVGTIKDTLYNGFVELPAPPTTVFAFVMGLMIDVLPLIFAFVAFHGYVRPEETKDIWEMDT